MRTGLKATIVSTLAGAALASGLATPAVASADQIGYIINVTLRPTWLRQRPEPAGLRLRAVRPDQRTSYRTWPGRSKADFSTNDELTVSYLLQPGRAGTLPRADLALRRSAAGYRPA